MLERGTEGCEDTDEARDYYDVAIAYVERTAEFAAEHPEHDPGEFESEAERLGDAKLERSGREFGKA